MTTPRLPRLPVDAEMLAKLDRVLDKPQTFTKPELEFECSFCGWTDGEHADGCPYKTEYHADIIDTRDLVGNHFVGPMAGR